VRVDDAAIFAVAGGKWAMSGTITPTDAEQVSEIMERVRTWPRSMRIALAKRVLDTLEDPEAGPATRGRPVEELNGIGSGDSPPPDDNQGRTWVDEHRMGTYG
jgi:hypothetical protein